MPNSSKLSPIHPWFIPKCLFFSTHCTSVPVFLEMQPPGCVRGSNNLAPCNQVSYSYSWVLDASHE